MSDLEKEVVSLVKFKGDYAVRQDYLAALLRATDKWLTKNDPKGDIFDNWDDGLANWYSDGIRAMHNKDMIQDFPDLELEEPEIEPIEEEDDTPEEAEQESDTQHEKIGQQNSTEGTVEATGVVDEVGTDEQKAPKKGRKVRISKIQTQYDELTGEKDRFGVTIGTKTHEAVKLYEQGTTSKELMQKVGGRHYNILTKLAQDGHLIEKRPSGGFKLTHKEDISK